MGRNRQRPVRAGRLRMFVQGNGFLGAVGAGPRHDRNATPDNFDGEGDHPFVLRMGQGGGLAGGSAGNNPVGTAADLPFYEITERSLVQLSVLKRRHNSDQGSCKHGRLHQEDSENSALREKRWYLFAPYQIVITFARPNDMNLSLVHQHLRHTWS